MTPSERNFLGYRSQKPSTPVSLCTGGARRKAVGGIGPERSVVSETYTPKVPLQSLLKVLCYGQDTC